MVALPLVGHGAATGAVAGSTSWSVAAMGQPLSGTAEAAYGVTYRTGGVISNLATYVTANDRGASTAKVRVNSADGNGAIAIGASATGAFEDLTGRDTIAVGDYVDFQYTSGSGGTVSSRASVTAHFSPAVPDAVIRGHVSTAGNISVASSTYFLPMCGFHTPATSATEAGMSVGGIAGTLRKLYVSVTANARTTTTTVRSRVNAANGAQSVSIGSTATGVFEDTTNEDSIANGDLLTFSVVTGSGTQNLFIAHVAYEYKTADQSWPMFGAISFNTMNSGLTRYMGLGGAPIVDATEATRQMVLRLTATLDRLYVLVTPNTVNGSSTVTLRANGADTGVTVSIGSSTTGTFTDNTHSASYNGGDTANLKIVTGGSSGSLTVRDTSLRGTAQLSSVQMLV